MFIDNPSYNPSPGWITSTLSWPWITGVLFAAEGGRLDPYTPIPILTTIVVIALAGIILVLGIAAGMYFYRRQAQGPEPTSRPVTGTTPHKTPSGDTYFLLSSEMQGTLELPEEARAAQTRKAKPIQRSILRCTICSWSLPILSIEDKAALDAAGMSLRDHYDQAHRGWDEEDGAGSFGGATPLDPIVPDKLEPREEGEGEGPAADQGDEVDEGKEE